MEASSSRNLDPVGNYTTTIPFDLTFEILSRLPAKSLIRFQSVSKLWFSIIRSKYFVDSFFTRSKTRPRLLFNFKFKHLDIPKQFIFSAPEHVDEENKTSLVMARHDMTISGLVYNIRSRPVNGFVCCKRGSSIAVCNPTTRQLVKLPDVEANGRDMYVRLGYDPVEDQFKVLCVLMSDGNNNVYRPNYKKQEHFVFTLSSQQKEWRKIETNEQVTYRRVHGGICINGAIYYGVGNKGIFRFDVRSEKIEFIQAPKKSHITTKFCSTLINYNGKLGGVGYHFNKGMGLWILEDAVKHEWSNIYALASDLRDVVESCVFSGEIHTGEVMEAKSRLRSSKPFSVFYLDYKTKNIRKVEVQGIADDDFRRVHGIDKLTDDLSMLSFPGYVENIRFL